MPAVDLLFSLALVPAGHRRGQERSMSEQRLADREMEPRFKAANHGPASARAAIPIIRLFLFFIPTRFEGQGQGDPKKIQRAKQAFRFLQARAAALCGSSFFLSGGFRLEGAYVVVTAFECL